MSDKLHAAALLKMASKDLRALRAMKDSNDFSDEIFGLHAQQVIEKCCKAWLALLNKKYPYTHDLSLLLEELEGVGCKVEKIWDYASMSAFATNLRYEGLDESDLPLDRRRIVEDLNDLFTSVDKILGAS